SLSPLYPYTTLFRSAKAVGLVPLARFDLVLLRVEVLLGSMFHGHVLTELEAAVDAIAGGERRRENEADLERRAPAGLQVVVEDVRRVRKEIRPHVFLQLG